MRFRDSWGIMRIVETPGDLLVSKRLLGTRVSARLMETIETKGDYWGLMKLIETAAYS